MYGTSGYRIDWASLVDQTAPFPSTGCIASPARGRCNTSSAGEGSGLVHETKTGHGRRGCIAWTCTSIYCILLAERGCCTLCTPIDQLFLGGAYLNGIAPHTMATCESLVSQLAVENCKF